MHFSPYSFFLRSWTLSDYLSDVLVCVSNISGAVRIDLLVQEGSKRGKRVNNHISSSGNTKSFDSKCGFQTPLGQRSSFAGRPIRRFLYSAFRIPKGGSWSIYVMSSL